MATDVGDDAGLATAALFVASCRKAKTKQKFCKDDLNAIFIAKARMYALYSAASRKHACILCVSYFLHHAAKFHSFN